MVIWGSARPEQGAKRLRAACLIARVDLMLERLRQENLNVLEFTACVAGSASAQMATSGVGRYLGFDLSPR